MSVTAKSVIFDFTDNWGSANYILLRSLEFWLAGAKIPMASGYAAYAQSYYAAGWEPWRALNTTLAKTGNMYKTSWETSSSRPAGQRLVVVFDTPLEFDQIVCNNGHSSGGDTDCGAKNTIVIITPDAITSTVYGEAVSNGQEIWAGVIAQHVAADVIDDQILISGLEGAPAATMINTIHHQLWDLTAYQPIGYREHHQPWALSYEPAGYLAHAQPWDLTAPLADSCNHLQPWGLALVASWRQPWGDAAQPRLAHAQWYGAAALPSLAHVQEYGRALASTCAHAQEWHLAAAARLTHFQPWALTGAPAHLEHGQPYSLTALNEARSSHVQPWALAAAATLDQEITLTASAAGRDLQQPLGCDITADLDRYCLECRLDLAGAADYLACLPHRPLVVTALGQEYHFLVTGRSRQRQPGRTDYAVEARSPTSLLDAPHAAALTMEVAPGLASVIAADLAAPAGITVEWSAVDWYVPAGRLFANEETPLQIIRKLAAAAGALLQSTPAGYLLRVVPAYPVTLTQWAEAVPDLHLSDAADFFTASEADDPRPGFNSFWISDQLESAHSRSLESTETAPGRHLVRCYPVPWTASLPPLATSGGPWVTTHALGVLTEQRTETVEMVGGLGRTTRPIHTIDALVWLHTSLGGISHGEDGSLQAETPGHSLLQLTYTARYHAWEVTTPYAEKVQFYLDEEEPS